MKEIVTYNINNIFFFLASVLQRKLDLFLNKEDGGGKVVDINFIPNYKGLLKLESKRTEITDLRNLIMNKETSCVRRWFFPRVYRTEESIKKELDRIDKKMQTFTEMPVVSSGHAFICFDSLLSCYRCLNEFQETTWTSFQLKLKNIWEGIKRKESENIRSSGGFGKFQDEDLEMEMISIEKDKVNIMVDQMIEPFDIIWANLGGDRGLYICRRIICNCFIFVTLIFLTTPTVWEFSIYIIFFSQCFPLLRRLITFLYWNLTGLLKFHMGIFLSHMLCLYLF
jgi:hypothetical protein